MAQWLTALTALAEDLNSVPGIQFNRSQSPGNSSSPFWLPWALCTYPNTHPQTYSNTTKNQRK